MIPDPARALKQKQVKKKKKILELQEEKHKEDTSGTKDVTQRKEVDKKNNNVIQRIQC